MATPTEIFDWLDRPVEQRETRYGKEATGYLLGIWEEVRQRLGPERFDPVLEAARAGRFGRRAAAAWTQTNGKHEGDLVNLTLEVEAEELSLNVVGWFDPQLEKVEGWFRTRRAKELLRTLDGWDLLIFVREAHVGPSGRATFQGARGVLRERFPITEVAPTNVIITLDGMRPKLESATEKLALHIRRGWRREEVLELADVAAAVTPEVERWLDPLREIRLA
ncbi:MAG: hypothetical protein ACJ76D_07235 [Solirubrobacterales bacterium]